MQFLVHHVVVHHLNFDLNCTWYNCAFWKIVQRGVDSIRPVASPTPVSHSCKLQVVKRLTYWWVGDMCLWLHASKLEINQITYFCSREIQGNCNTQPPPHLSISVPPPIVPIIFILYINITFVALDLMIDFRGNQVWNLVGETRAAKYH